MKRTTVVPLALLLLAAAALGAQRTTVLQRVRQQSRVALQAVQREVKSWMGAMRRHVRGLRRGVADGAERVTDAGRETVTQLKDTFATLRRQTTESLHDGMTLVAREFVPVGEEAVARPEAAAPALVTSPATAPAFLRRHDIQLAWHVTTGGRPIRRSRVLEDNLLLEDTANDLYALHPRNGIANWIYPLPGPSQYDYRVDDDALAVVVNDVYYELDRGVGMPRRRFVLPFASASRPYLHGDSVLFSSVDDRIYSIERETRVREWSHLATDHVVAGVVARANTVYYTQVDGKVFAHQPGDRKPLWDYRADDAVRVTPVVEGDNLFFPARDLFVHALNRLGGFRVWKFPVRGQVTQPVWVERETVYFAAAGDGFYAVSRDTGEQRWFVPGARWPVAVGQKNVYLQGPDRTVLAVDRETGKEVWRVSAKPFTYFVRNTTSDYIYLVTDRGQVHAFYLRGDHVEKKEEPPPPPLRPGEEPTRPSPKAAPKAPAPTPTPPAPKAKTKEETKKEEEEEWF